MEEKTLIRLYQRRTFSEKFSATIDFVRENWKPILKYFTYFMLPFAIIQGVVFEGMMNAMPNDNTNSDLSQLLGSLFFAKYGAYMLIYVIVSLIVGSMVFSMIQLYATREGRLQNLQIGELWNSMKQNLWRLLFAEVIMFVIFVAYTLVIVVTAVVSLYTLILTIPAFFVMMVPLVFLLPVSVFDKASLSTLVVRTFKFGFITWGGTFGFIFVISLVANIISGIATTPWYVIYLFQYMMPMIHHSQSLSPSVGMEICSYLSGIFMAYGNSLSSVLVLIGVAFQYGHATEVCENVTIDSEIDKFDKEGDDSLI
jgi:hypothetical protein